MFVRSGYPSSGISASTRFPIHQSHHRMPGCTNGTAVLGTTCCNSSLNLISRPSQSLSDSHIPTCLILSSPILRRCWGIGPIRTANSSQQGAALSLLIVWVMLVVIVTTVPLFVAFAWGRNSERTPPRALRRFGSCGPACETREWSLRGRGRDIHGDLGRQIPKWVSRHHETA